MDLKLKNKIVLITGSSRGIGKTIAEKLSEEGCRVILNSRNIDELEKTAKNIPNSFPIAGDVCKQIDCQFIIEKILKNFGKLDALICNVGSGKSVKPGNENYDEWKKSFDMNFYSATNIIEKSKEELMKTKGSIVCISSICGMESIQSAPVTYSVSKAALNVYVTAISKSLGLNGVRINAIAPGNILFSGSTWDKKMRENSKFVKKMLTEKVPLQKFGAPQDIANLACYLISHNSNFCTGSIWKIDGGQTSFF
tara:strand:+ start:25455 stop:26213 length:759 start_codon:yes stop_codon:yes gene_type:complete